MRLYKKETVFEEALNRIRRLFDEFPNVIVGVSGGKDSTVVYNLALIVAREKKRLPLRVLFLDQEIEWEATIEQIKTIMYNPEVEPLWMQIPIVLFNATSFTDHWLKCWNPEEKEKWMRPKDPIAIHENTFNEMRFAKMFSAIIAGLYPDTKTCYISGVRTEESPARKMGLTTSLTYKDITWGRILDRKRQHYTFHPVYDWSYLDVWKAIHDNNWPYNKIYDYQYQYGVPVYQMRVSNLHHETAVRSLFHLQELEPHTYEMAVQRVPGLDMAGKMGKDNYFVKDLPFMFKDWKEYRDYLLEKLITDSEWRKGFEKKFIDMDKKYDTIRDIQSMYKMEVQSILTNDWEFVKLENWERSPTVDWYRKWKKTGKLPVKADFMAHIPLHVKHI